MCIRDRLSIGLKIILDQLDGWTIAWARFAGSALVLWAFHGVAGRLPAKAFLTLGALKLVLVASVGLAGNYLGWISGLRYVSPATAGLVIQLSPLFLALAAALIFRERIGRMQAAGFVLLLAGLVVYFRDQVGLLVTDPHLYGLGVLMIGLSGASWVLYGLAQKQLLRDFASPQTVDVYKRQARPRAVNQAVAVVTPTLDPAAATVYECEAMETAGTIVMKQPDHIAMATAGTATGTVRVPADGEYVLAVRGWGSPAQGIWPLIQISVDGRAVGAVQLEGREAGVFGAAAELLAGERQVELRFVNDQQIVNEDRNAYLDALLLAPAAIKLAGTALTSPPAVMAREIGRGLVVLDEVRWHDAPGNTDKARRHLASLLTAMGANCRAPGGTVVEAETFTIQPGLQHNRAEGGFQTMAQGGWFEGPVRVATAGRYRLTVTARGTIAGDGWPHATLTLNGQQLGEVMVTGSGWDDYPIDVDLQQGDHVLRLEFDNDLNVDGQDRNLFVDRFRFEAR